MSKQDLVIDFCAFLKKQVELNEITGDQKESVDLVIDCLQDAFKLPTTDSDRDLLEIYESARATDSKSESNKSDDSDVYVAVEVSEEDRAAAEELKAEGNKLMARHLFKEAADKYTEAIEKNPNNALFYSNRAAAFTHLSLPDRAVEDSRKAVHIDPLYAKAWSRLGHALWTQNDIKGSLEAYENGLKAEGDSPTEAMKRDYESVKKRFQEMKANPESFGTKSADSADAGAGAGAGAGGFDLSNLAGMMNNPQIRQMASEFMSNPEKLKDLMNNPMVQALKDSFANGNGPKM